MDYKEILTKEEAKIWEKANVEFKKLKEEMEKPAEKIEKTLFSSAGMTKSADLISDHLRVENKKFWKQIKTANAYYKALKSAMDEKDTTHEFITKKALDLLGIYDSKTWNTLKPACMDPDKKKKMFELVYEGHFFGKTKGNKLGNFLPRVFKKWSMFLLEHIDDTEETAASNFSKYFRQSQNGSLNLKMLGWASHYIQDLTAPHHVGNLAVGFEIITDNTATHFLFEKYARKYVYDNPDAFTNKAKRIYTELKKKFKPAQPEKFAKEIYKRAVPNVPDVKTISQASWDRVIKKAIPLAIGATALVLEPLR